MKRSRGNSPVSGMTAEENVLRENTKPESLGRNMRVFLLFATVIIIAITIALTLKTKPEITQESLQQEIQSLQQQLPIKIDANTELKSVEVEGMQIKYSFVVVDDPTKIEGINSKDKNFASTVETSVKTSACLNKSIRRYINSDVSLAYRYMDQDNETLVDFIIPAGFCKP